MKVRKTRYLIPLLILTIIITFCSFSCSPSSPGNQTIEEPEEEVAVDEPEEVPIEEPKAEETVVKGEPFTMEDCYENLDISLGINIDEVKIF